MSWRVREQEQGKKIVYYFFIYTSLLCLTRKSKTLAFLIPTVERITRSPSFLPGNSIGCLIIAPTRELAIQIGEEAKKLLTYHTDLTVQVMYGGTKISRDMNLLNKKMPTILVATPGRILEHLQDTRVRGRKFSDDIIANTNILVLDEVDRLVNHKCKYVTFLPPTTN